MAMKITIPWELKYKYARGMLTTLFKGFMYVIRERHGAAEALEIHQLVNKMDNRIQNMIRTLKDVFKIEENDIKALRSVWEIYLDLTGIISTTLEQSEKLWRHKITTCAWVTEPKDLSDWCYNYCSLMNKFINPKTTLERPKAMCTGDSECEFVVKIEE
ncbi:hypothetical protein [Candidatus Borrarchaeum sp.]|uniref:hypothetical protein n=1 Tax=Candidatus Borrarchaeum sp. TaxID=2846742 RepID=UPI00258093E5|nr:hypothetical protein [Candidatus Borrarchaeum sp.]